MEVKKHVGTQLNPNMSKIVASVGVPCYFGSQKTVLLANPALGKPCHLESPNRLK